MDRKIKSKDPSLSNFKDSLLNPIQIMSNDIAESNISSKFNRKLLAGGGGLAALGGLIYLINRYRGNNENNG